MAEKLDIDLEMIPHEQIVYNQIAGAEVIKSDGSGFEKLVTITDEDITEMGVEGTPQTGRITLAEFREKGVYQVKTQKGDVFGNIQHKAFRDDPEANPLPTPSGKLHIHSAGLSQHVAAFGWDEIPPIAKYLPPKEGVEETWDGEYPLQLWSPHYLRRSHSVFDNVTWLREAFPQEVWLNPIDAEARGIEQGDTILISTRHGKAIRPVKIDEGIMPGTVATGEGAWVERDDETGIDMAGATNSLMGNVPSGQGVQAWNTSIAQVEKWTGKSLEADYKWPQRIPIKEA
jgi:anaerobic dimethyl sulfoxide reductase subunit A